MTSPSLHLEILPKTKTEAWPLNTVITCVSIPNLKIVFCDLNFNQFIFFYLWVLSKLAPSEVFNRKPLHHAARFTEVSHFKETQNLDFPGS